MFFFCTIRKEGLNDPLLGSGSVVINLQGEIWVRESIKSTEQSSCLNDSSYFMISKTSPFPFYAKNELILMPPLPCIHTSTLTMLFC